MIKIYLRAFINWKQNDWVNLLPMAELAYNNAKITSTNHILFELNCGYHPKVLFKEDVNPYSKSYFANKLAKKHKKLMKVYYQNLIHIQKLEK